MRKKLERFSDNAERRNVIEKGKPVFEVIKGNWKKELFGNDNDLVVEFGCGRGEYTVGLAEKFPDKNFIGVDIKGARIWVGSTYAINNQLDNVAFLRVNIVQLEDYFAKDEVSEVWVTFPDPRPKDRDEKRRLTSPRYLEMYKGILKKDGWLKFKTDNTPLFDYTLSLFEDQVKIKNLQYTYDLYNSEFMDEHYGVKTKYEKLFHDQGESIKYMKFQFEKS
ncbi:tRNA (guanosine(46)-N7)-methyltransferase TrmB [Reichenbachiella sp. MALMAid0571]|uniref:tRNA (guanosine(46)-N7)-methyltransferase TrmB n=1 Tax=Reichenbachiella sp. MALMAid0571 TaxID=3143939 RepID=UPI0032DE2C0F